MGTMTVNLSIAHAVAKCIVSAQLQLRKYYAIPQVLDRFVYGAKRQQSHHHRRCVRRTPTTAEIYALH